MKMIEQGEKLLQKDDRMRREATAKKIENDQLRRKAIATKKMKTKRGEKLLQKKMKATK
jgi:hypothetical protein